MLAVLLAVSASAAAQLAPFAPFAPCAPLASGGFTRTVSASAVAGTFIPPQAQVSDTFYSFPGVSAFGAYPGGGYSSLWGVGLTPGGYGPYGGFTYL